MLLTHMKLLLPALLLSLSLQAAEPALTFPGADGRDHTPLKVGDKKAVTLFFVSPYCPTANTFVKEMNQIAADYGSQIAFYFVHSDTDLKITDVLQHTELNAIKAPALMDKDQRLAKMTRATITPEAVVLAPDGRTLYQGRINDLYLGPTKRQRKATTKDLRDALDAILAGKPVSQPRTEAVGCKISGMK